MIVRRALGRDMLDASRDRLSVTVSRTLARVEVRRVLLYERHVSGDDHVDVRFRASRQPYS